MLFEDEWAPAKISMPFQCNFLCRRCWITADLLPKYIAPCFRLFCNVALSLKSLWFMVNCHQSLSCILFPCWLNMFCNFIVTWRGIANLPSLLAFQLRHLLICCIECTAGRQVPISNLFSLSMLLFFLFFSNFLLFFLFFSQFTYNKQIFVRDLNILSLFKYFVYRVH